MQVVGGYAQPLDVKRPDRIDIDAVKQSAKTGIKSVVPYETKTPYTGGKVRALFMGCNYTGQSAALSGCVNDVQQVLKTMEAIDFPIQECAVLVDDSTFPHVSGEPTLENMKKYMAWLVADAKAGDVLYLHYSGHGGRTKAVNDTEEDYDSSLIPLDYQTKGTILDDDLFLLLVKPLPAGVRLTCVFDCCHSASMLDLPFSFTASSDIPDKVPDASAYTMKQVRKGNFSNGDVLMLSGCTDEGTSADVSNTATFGSDVKGAGGAATQGFCNFLEKEHGSKYFQAIIDTRKILSEKHFQQVPQLTSSKPVDLNKDFSLFGTLTVDETMMQECVPQEYQKPAPKIQGIPPRFRINGMPDFDPSVFKGGFMPPPPPHPRWGDNPWAQGHPDPRMEHRQHMWEQMRGRGGRGGGGGGRGGPMGGGGGGRGGPRGGGPGMGGGGGGGHHGMGMPCDMFDEELQQDQRSRGMNDFGGGGGRGRDGGDFGGGPNHHQHHQGGPMGGGPRGGGPGMHGGPGMRGGRGGGW